jgi:hypothetical protein
MVSKKMIVTCMLIAATTLVGAGCSDDNPVNPTTSLDTAPPAVPSNLSVEYASQVAQISWDMSTVDPDLAGYIVTREQSGITEILVAAPAMISSYEDANPPLGTSMYHVYAVDETGNQSAVATVSLTVITSHQTGYLHN